MVTHGALLWLNSTFAVSDDIGKHAKQLNRMMSSTAIHLMMSNSAIHFDVTSIAIFTKERTCIFIVQFPASTTVDVQMNGHGEVNRC